MKGSWETNFVSGRRHWSPEAQALFGLTLPEGIGTVGGDNDEFRVLLHPDDRYLAAEFHALADTVDSFPAEYRIVRPDGKIVCLSGHGQVITRTAHGKCERLVSVVADITERKKKEDHIRFLMQEMSHRSKNLLAVIQSVAKQTILTTNSSAEFQQKLQDRLQGIARSHELLIDQDWHGADLGSLVLLQLAPFVEPGSARVRIEGPDVQVNSNAAQAIGLALHELATNAVKYGAWSGTAGSVTISWAFETNADQEIQMSLIWQEQDGPRVEQPTRKGFGNAIISKIAPQSISGTAVLEFEPSGLHWTLTLPKATFVSAFR